MNDGAGWPRYSGCTVLEVMMNMSPRAWTASGHIHERTPRSGGVGLSLST